MTNAEQRAASNGDRGHRWVADAERRDRVLAPAADAMLTAAELRGGEQVLDVGCGCGATTLAGAAAVAPGGRDPADATDYLANTGVGSGALDTVADDQRPAALDAIRSVLAERAPGPGPPGAAI